MIVKWISLNKLTVIVFAVTAVVWGTTHLPIITYGTDHTPLHVSYWTADEQSGINGALHMLQEKSILGLRNQTVLYYGPMLALFAVPAAVTDFGIKYVSGEVSGSDAYRDTIIWNWGGILAWARFVAVVVGYLGLVAVYLLFRTTTINPSRTRWVPAVATLLLASSYLYFELTGVFRHWVFIVTFLLWQLYLAIRITEEERARNLWIGQGVLTVAAFGISYLSVLYQAFWVPLLYRWIRDYDLSRLKAFIWYILGAVIGGGVMIWWHPYAFVRILGLVGIIDPISIDSVLDITTVETAQSTSFVYYAHVVFFAVLPLLVFAGVVLGTLRRRVFASGQVYVFGMLLVPAILNYIVFSIPALHVVRYVFPTVVLLILSAALLMSYGVTIVSKGDKLFKVSAAILGLFVVLNIVQIGGWLRMVEAGPVERRDIIPQIHAWHEENPSAKILMVKNWPLGYVHTSEAYDSYIDTHNKSKYELWQYIRTLAPPDDVVPLNVYYEYAPYTVTDDDRAKYGHIVVHNPPATSPTIWHETPEDEYDYYPWHVWNFEKYQESYTIVQ